MTFTTQYEAIIKKVKDYDPLEYSASRNYIDGHVSYLSPYISRGVISTRMVMNQILSRNYPWYKIEKFIQELSWRDYWQNCWLHIENIDEDIKQNQTEVYNFSIPKSVRFGRTGISAIDKGISDLKDDGYMHNHLRMYVASLCCNFGHSHWLAPAKWMFYHLYDGDWASNALSWQWVAGSNSGKKYVFNQENVNRYCHTDQHNTYLDIPYDTIENIDTPNKLEEIDELGLKTNLPDWKEPTLRKKKINLFTYYNLDPTWNQSDDSDNLLILEPNLFKKYPISDNVLNFTIELSKNIPNIKYYCGNFKDLQLKYPKREFHFKEHPTNNHFTGVKYDRDWMFNVHRYYSSFFSYWKKCKATREWNKK
jgi:deoxyribodipyrimidine photo-lyase